MDKLVTVLLILVIVAGCCIGMYQDINKDLTILVKNNGSGLGYSFALFIVMIPVGVLIHAGFLSLFRLSEYEAQLSSPRLTSFLTYISISLTLLPPVACLFLFYDFADILISVILIISFIEFFILFIYSSLLLEMGIPGVLIFVFLGIPLTFGLTLLTAYALCTPLYLPFPGIDWYSMLFRGLNSFFP